MQSSHLNGVSKQTLCFISDLSEGKIKVKQMSGRVALRVAAYHFTQKQSYKKSLVMNVMKMERRRKSMKDMLS